MKGGVMRALILGAMIAGGLIGSAAAQERPGAGRMQGRLFVSPMGEPFRAGLDAPAPEQAWFDGADADHDGALTLAEMQTDAARFFAILDVRKDGEIDPDDIERYENILFPEVRSVGPGNRGGRVGEGLGGDYGDIRARAKRKMRAKQGAQRFGYLDYPQPVTVADRNFNRGVDPTEFAKAAEARFDMLDTNKDGRIVKSELPKL
jgi:hypothetical protein